LLRCLLLMTTFMLCLQPSLAVNDQDTDFSNLYSEVVAMLEVSNLIYALTVLGGDRKDIKDDDLSNPNFLDSLPRSMPEVSDWLKTNIHVLDKSIHELSQTKDQQEFYLENMESILSHDAKKETTLEVLDNTFGFSGDKSEVVYGITRNPVQKRLTVVFRGSIVEKDWDQNFKFRAETVELLTPGLLEQIVPNATTLVHDSAQVHSGFFEYLFKLPAKNTNSTKFVKIINEVLDLLKSPANQGYSIYVTGHSLGAAIATLAAMGLSISNDITHPVTLVTFASPHVGKLDFVKLFQALEKDGRLFHRRVTNNNDLTPQLLGPLGYRHTGFHLNLIQPGPFTLFRKKLYNLGRTKVEGNSFWTNNMAASLSWFTPGPGDKHRLHVSMQRLERSKNDLRKEPRIANLYQDVEYQDLSDEL